MKKQHTEKIDSVARGKTDSEFKLLIVDDDPAIVDLIRLFLKPENFKLHTAFNGEEALAKIDQNGGYDLLILDIMMPKLDGLETTKAIRKQLTPFELPILIVSALSESKDVATVLGLGANDYITKPINKIEFLARIRNLLSLKQFYELAKANERLVVHQTLYDHLTALPNRAFLIKHFPELISETNRKKKGLTVLLLNIDRFRSVNDSLGHNVGDFYLREIAQRIGETLEKEDLLARLYTDTFAVVKMGLSLNLNPAGQIKPFAEKLLDLIRKPVTIDQYELKLSAGMGVAFYPSDARAMDELIRLADSAMYAGKEKRKNSIVFYSDIAQKRESKIFSLEHKLEEAMKKNEFVLHYQPQIDIVSGKIAGVEALLRWNHPQEGLIPPERFIPFAEESGIIIPLSEWVLEQACIQNKKWQEAGLPPLRIGVNFSPQHFHNAHILEFISRILEKTKLAPQYLELEITEGTIMSNVEEAIETLFKLKDMGVRISIDDFGTGYSSLNYLKQFPVDTLKIDQSFITHDIAIDQQVRAIIASIIKLGHSLNLKVIAEGVETEDQVKYLQANYCNEIQGFYYSKPQSPENLENYLKKQIETK
ncbi:MAG: EAL domain-containing protein [Fidelibacterota bacterium]